MKSSFSLKEKNEIKEFLIKVINICKKIGIDHERIIKSIGSLGGG